MSDKKISGFWSGFTKGLVSTISAEIGDKTFFVAAMLSMKHSPFIVFTGAASALLLMTVFSVVIRKFLMFAVSSPPQVPDLKRVVTPGREPWTLRTAATTSSEYLRMLGKLCPAAREVTQLQPESSDCRSLSLIGSGSKK